MGPHFRLPRARSAMLLAEETPGHANMLPNARTAMLLACDSDESDWELSDDLPNHKFRSKV